MLQWYNFYGILTAIVVCISQLILTDGSLIAKAQVSTTIDFSVDIYEMECMQPYIKIIDKVNVEYGTELAVPTEEIINEANLNKKEIVEYYTAIDVEEFEEYLILLYQKSLSEEEEEQIEISQVRTLAFSQYQRYVFTNGNYLFFDSVVYYGDGDERYLSIGSCKYLYSKTPFYKPYDFKYTLMNGNTKVKCTFICYKFINENLMYETLPSVFTGIFDASGGDIYQYETT